MRYAILAQAILAALTAAAPSEYAVKETHFVPSSFVKLGDAPADRLLRLSIGLKHSDFEGLERDLYEVSDPEHPRYGQHLSQEEINRFIQPHDEALAAVVEWLHEHISPEDIEYSPANDYLHIVMPIADVERLLDTSYGHYMHEDGTELMRTTQWSLPIHLHEHITHVQPTTSFLRPRAQMKTSMVPTHVEIPASSLSKSKNVKDNCDTAHITPQCLRSLYGTLNYKPSGKAQMGMTDYLGQVNNRSDTKIFLQTLRPQAVSAATSFKQVSVNGGTTQQTPLNQSQIAGGIGVEGNLDIQTILGQTYPLETTVWSTAGSPPFTPDKGSPTDENEPYLTWLHYILKQKDIPQTISNSYADDEQTVPLSYANAVCSHFAQLGARGVSVFFGSGDGGVSGVQNPGTCESNVSGKKEFVPLFPSSCPYITSVGATVNLHPEVVAFDPANGFASGGGFSNYFGQPSYQKSAVEGFLKKMGNKYSQYYNASGRAYPDIAAYGVNYTINYGGQFYLVDGTSAATPTAASVFGLINDALIAAGKKPLGWLNPWLYSKGYKGFTDVTKGNTRGCNTTGFTATTGWDAASGFGTPNFNKILKIAKSS